MVQSGQSNIFKLKKKKKIDVMKTNELCDLNELGCFGHSHLS